MIGQRDRVDFAIGPERGGYACLCRRAELVMGRGQDQDR